MLKGAVRPIREYSESEIQAMYALMAQFYDDTKETVFRHDFFAKDYCLALYDEYDRLVGFTTQKVMEFEVEGKTIHGVFSGDTIIHKEYWGDIKLFQVWANFWFDYAKQYDEFYWFLISKGYKTYRMMPLFWTEFYPNYRIETPQMQQKIIEAYASILYPKEYNQTTGVIEYQSVKDKLKIGVADIGEQELKNNDVAYFIQRNPSYRKGNDLACLAKIDKSVLKRRAIGLLFP